MDQEKKDKLKQKAVSIGEAHLMQMVDDVEEVAKILAEGNPVLNSFASAFGVFKGSIKEALDKIDGEDDFQG